MKTVNFHEAKTNLSRLIDQAVNGEPFVICKAGKPLVRVTAIGASVDPRRKRVGFMAGEASIPDDFDTMGQTEIGKLFSGSR